VVSSFKEIIFYLRLTICPGKIIVSDLFIQQMMIELYYIPETVLSIPEIILL
jgi:hypothetical protein